VLSLYWRGTVYPYWGGGTHAARAARANELMYYELMRHAARRGCTRFDFGRSKVGTGAYAFKKNWGFAPSSLVYAHWGESREVNPLNPRYRLRIALWRRLPLWLANALGPTLARGLG
jgi:lipid II:glycine glycyltransferase (peptidoglycan interpeptide bridge formation enzyme)